MQWKVVVECMGVTSNFNVYASEVLALASCI